MILRDQNNGSFSITRNQKQYLAQAQEKKSSQTSKMTVNIISDENRNIVDLVIKSAQIPKTTYILLHMT